MASLNAIRVPSDAKDNLALLARLSEAQVEDLTKALRDTAEVSTVSDFKALLGSTVVWEGDLDALVGHLLSLSALRTSHGFGAEELARQIPQIVDRDLTDDQQRVLAQALTAILGAPSLGALTKALDIHREQDRFYHTGRIVTDIRPVFGDDPSEEPLGSLVLHTLRLDYFEGGRVKSLGFSLDSADLQELRRSIERAELKERTLDSKLAAMGWRHYRLEEDD